MKKLAIILFTMTSVLSFSQLEKGEISIGGNVSGTYKNEDTKNTTYKIRDIGTSFNISHNISYFVKNNLAIIPNLSIGYGDYERKTERVFSNSINYQDNYNEHNLYGIGIGIKKFIPLSEKLFFTLYPNLTYSHRIQTHTFVGSYSYLTSNDSSYWTNITENRTNSINFSFAPGFAYRVSNKVLLTANTGRFFAGYSFGKSNYIEKEMSIRNSNTESTESEDKTGTINQFNSNFSLINSISIGFNYFIK